MAILRVHVIPGAKIDAVAGEQAGGIKIRLRARAIEGKANAALIRFVAEQLKLPRHAVLLERGRKSRHKLLRIAGLSDEEVRKRLQAAD